MVGNVEDVAYELQIASLCERNLLLKANIINHAPRILPCVRSDRGNQIGAAGAIPIVRNGCSRIRFDPYGCFSADRDGIGKAVLRLEAIVQAPVVRQVSRSEEHTSELQSL